MAKNTKKRTVIYSNVKENKKLAEERKKKESGQINLDDEVIIGFNSKKKNGNTKAENKKKAPIKRGVEPKKNKSEKQKLDKTKMVKKQKAKKVPPKEKVQKPAVKKQRRRIKIPKSTKIIVLLLIVGAGVFAFLKSSFFNIKQIDVKIDRNSMLTVQEIKDLANITIDENMFSINKKKSIDSIKSNSYVDSVKIKRRIPNTLSIEVVERTVKFQIKTDNEYYYVDEHGVVIDKSTEAKDCITIVGQHTQEMKKGESLNEDDIQGLSDVLAIIQEAQSNDLKKDITKIDITNHYDYLVYFENIGKIAHIGDASALNDKMIRVVKIIKVESEFEGEIFVNVDFNKGEYPYFREKV